MGSGRVDGNTSQTAGRVSYSRPLTYGALSHPNEAEPVLILVSALVSLSFV